MAARPASTPARTPEQLRQRRVAAASIVAALALVLIKLAAGLAANSLGLLAEALHSTTDLVAAILTFVAVRVGQRPPDRTHPFGHGRAEHLAALGESLLLLGATLLVAWHAGHRLVTGGHGVHVHGWLLAVALVVIAIDSSRAWASHRAAQELGSPALASNALHFASDLAGSVAVFVGLGLVALGFEAGDSLAALVVAAIIAVSAGRLGWENAQVLMDVADEDAERQAARAIQALDLPLTVRRMRIRRSAGAHLADVVIGVAAVDHVGQGHAYADEVERAIEAALPGSDVVVHVEPDDTGSTLRDRVTAAALARPGIHEVHNVRVLLIDGVPEVSMHVKMRGDLRLDTAHDLVCDVERSIRAAVPGISHVDVHLEPVDADARAADPVRDDAVLRAVHEAVLQVTGREAVSARLRYSDRGLVVHVTVLAAPEQSLRDAHKLATLVENRICELAADVDDVLVHTVPA